MKKPSKSKKKAAKRKVRALEREALELMDKLATDHLPVEKLVEGIVNQIGHSVQTSNIPPIPESLKEDFRALTCSCWNPAHTATIFFDDDEWYMTFHLNSSRPFWWRLWAAVKYVFRARPSKFGHWDEIVIRRHDLLQLKKMLSVVY